MRREALLEAVEKLKNGETIGPVTKAYKEKEEEDRKEEQEAEKKAEAGNAEKKEQETEKEEETDKNERKTLEGEAKTEATVQEDKGEDAADKDSSEKENKLTTAPESPTSEASEQTVTPGPETTESKEPAAILKHVDSDTTSEATSTELDLPPTPASIEPITAPGETEPKLDLDELIQANIHESLEVRNPVPSKAAGAFTTDAKLLPITPPVPEETTVSDHPKPTSPSTEPTTVTELPPIVTAEASVPAVLGNGTPEEGDDKTEVVVPTNSAKTMVGWEMLQMCINWIIKEFSTDEEALARQLSNNEISFRFLWLYFVPGTIVSLLDSVSKQQMAARVTPPHPFAAWWTNGRCRSRAQSIWVLILQ